MRLDVLANQLHSFLAHCAWRGFDPNKLPSGTVLLTNELKSLAPGAMDELPTPVREAVRRANVLLQARRSVAADGSLRQVLQGLQPWCTATGQAPASSTALQVAPATALSAVGREFTEADVKELRAVLWVSGSIFAYLDALRLYGFRAEESFGGARCTYADEPLMWLQDRSAAVAAGAPTAPKIKPLLEAAAAGLGFLVALHHSNGFQPGQPDELLELLYRLRQQLDNARAVLALQWFGTGS